jgi:hypothetical protein
MRVVLDMRPGIDVNIRLICWFLLSDFSHNQNVWINFRKNFLMLNFRENILSGFMILYEGKLTYMQSDIDTSCWQPSSQTRPRDPNL